MESNTGVRITIPAIPNFFTILIIILFRFVNRRAGMNLGTDIFSEVYILTLTK
jgi:hypothetical protein